MDTQQVQIKVKTQENNAPMEIDNTPIAELPEVEQKDISTEMKFLARTWLDDFEKQNFNGKTLDQVLNRTNYE